MQIQPYKYSIIKEYIIDSIKTSKCKYGEKIPSENELANMFNMSRQTVRKAINILVNENWLESVHGSGTYVHKTIESKKIETKTIGAILTYPDEYIFPNIIKGIESTLSDLGYHISLGFTYNKVEKEAECLKSFIEKDIDGLIIESTKSALPNPNMDLFLKLRNKNIPYIFINGSYNELVSSYVVMDDENSGFLATDYLLKNGHTKIGGIFKSDDIQGHLRYKGFVKALHNKGVEVLEDNILWFTTEDIVSVFQNGYDKLLLDRFIGITAVVCYNDQISLKFIEVLKKNNIRIPEDISIISFDNSSLAELSSPELTSLSHLGSNLGENAAINIIEMIKTGKIFFVKLKSEIIERNSVKLIK